ncbi:unnamed protein product, partial [Amoebophrya sp. A120]|eukprot:GSA120T00017683001.1
MGGGRIIIMGVDFVCVHSMPACLVAGGLQASGLKPPGCLSLPLTTVEERESPAQSGPRATAPGLMARQGCAVEAYKAGRWCLVAAFVCKGRSGGGAHWAPATPKPGRRPSFHCCRTTAPTFCPRSGAERWPAFAAEAAAMGRGRRGGRFVSGGNFQPQAPAASRPLLRRLAGGSPVQVAGAERRRQPGAHPGELF